MYLDLVRRCGLLERMVALETIELTTTADYLREGAQDRLVCEVSARLVSAGAEAVVVTGAAVAGIAHRLAPRGPVPLVGGVGCAVGQAGDLGRLGRPHPPPAPPPAPGGGVGGGKREVASRVSRI